MRFSIPSRQLLPLALALGLGLAQQAVIAAPTCTFLSPVGGDGTSPIVSKSVGRGKLIGKTNWNTDLCDQALHQL